MDFEPCDWCGMPAQIRERPERHFRRPGLRGYRSIRLCFDDWPDFVMHPVGPNALLGTCRRCRRWGPIGVWCAGCGGQYLDEW